MQTRLLPSVAAAVSLALLFVLGIAIMTLLPLAQVDGSTEPAPQSVVLK
jgi:hypothetical protein